MKTAVINIKTDADIKSSAQKIAANMGLNLSTVLNGYLRQFIREEKLEFTPVYKLTKVAEKRALKAVSDYQQGKNTYGPFKTSAEIAAFLDN